MNHFIQSFVVCIFNLKNVGWTNAVFGASGVVFSIAFGYLTKYLTQPALIVFILMISIVNSIFMLTWTPDPSELYIIFLISISFGTTRAYYIGQIRGLYSISFPQNYGAQSAASLFQAIGFALGVLISYLFCAYIKLYIILIITSLSLICYFIMIGRKNYQELHEPEESKVERRLSVIADLGSKRFSATKF
jgi:predicted MFS family arabinose efflux permease